MTDALLGVVIALPVIASVVPLVASFWREEIGWYVAVVALVLNAVLIGSVVRSFVSGGILSHEVGGVAVPYGIELALDGLSAPVLVVIAVVSVGTLAYTRTAGPRSNSFYSGYLLLTAGLVGVTVTADVFNLYVFIEITGLGAYALIASGGDGRSAYAALKYLLVGTVGASLYLIGIAYAFVATGTLNMADLSARLADVGYGDTIVLASFAFIIAGLGVKVALFPLHTWQPDAYSASPYGVAGYVSALVSTVAAYALGRVILTVYTPGFLTANPVVSSGLIYFGALSIVAGSVLAVLQTDVRRLLAYSSVSQFGLIVAGFGIGNTASVFGSVVHLFGHAVMKGALFLTAGIIAYRFGVTRLDEYAGVARRVPYAGAAFAVLALSLVGVPPAIGFVGKWYVALGAVRAGETAVAVVIFASTLLTLMYVARLLDRMYYGEAPEAVADGGGGTRVTRGMVALVVLASVAVVALGPSASAVQETLALGEVLGG
ncbi:monovalent cation/H+ antiporter subunit D family protein [Haladaptatus sp. F3-133]|uniref:Monovalent cation/H+ antiporter subunit D family protein n=1 Tax=Halorutilus salinus TaxID=2487751 RepID=A0A9Q4C5J6_9EURY|nr:monovalent cation/H+ antiporter subunit D family protein [Halorutilus salinus]